MRYLKEIISLLQTPAPVQYKRRHRKIIEIEGDETFITTQATDKVIYRRVPRSI